MSFAARVDGYIDRLEGTLDNWLPPEDRHPKTLHQAMRYAALNGGKHFRPLLMYAAAETLQLPPERVDGPAAAVEMVHAYSLIHDDLPAMDDDDLRRGKPTCHVAFGEATAILAGDALQALAFHVLAHDPKMTPDPARRVHMIDILAKASGSYGMAGGQAIDLAATGKSLSAAEVEDMHIHKTGSLIRATVLLACHSCQAIDAATLQGLDHYAKCVGLAFQIQDDILDEEADTAILGKTQGADRALNKPTYPSVVGMEQARLRARRLTDDAVSSLESLNLDGEPLTWIAEHVVGRSH